MLKFTRDIPVEHLISRHIRFLESRKLADAAERGIAIKPCITVSREIGSRGVELAKHLADRLNWQIFDKEIVEYIAKNAHVRQEMVEIFDEKTRSEMDVWIMRFLDRHALSSTTYFKHLATTMLAIGKHGFAVVLGRGANFFIGDEQAIKVRIIAPLDMRVNKVAAELEISDNEALQFIRKTERDSAAYVKRFFHRDIKDPLHYDLVLNLGVLDLPVAAQAVLSALAQKLATPFEQLIDGKAKRKA